MINYTNFLSMITQYIRDKVITPRACARGKVIDRVVVVVVVVSRKIAISRASVCFESRDMLHERHK